LQGGTSSFCDIAAECFTQPDKCSGELYPRLAQDTERAKGKAGGFTETARGCRPVRKFNTPRGTGADNGSSSGLLKPSAAGLAEALEP